MVVILDRWGTALSREKGLETKERPWLEIVGENIKKKKDIR
jgi:hypothetical protein